MVSSIIIPVYHEEGRINETVSYLARLEGLNKAEVIIVDGAEGSTLEAMKAQKLSIRGIVCPKGRARQLNTGAEAASGEALLFLHADTRLPHNALRLVSETLRRYEAGAFDLSIETAHPFIKLVSLVGSIRSRLTRVPYGDQAQFIRRSTFERIGGFPDIPLMEDVALMDKLRAERVPIRILNEKARTSDRRWVKEGPIAGTLRNWRLISAYRLGVPAERLVANYRPHRDGAGPEANESAQKR